jgi:hypothetical protein
MTQKVLNYDQANIVDIQDTYYWCGPTSTGIVLSTFGIEPGQQELANELGTTTDGTADIANVTPVLNHYLPQALYADTHITGPTDAEKQAFWAAIVNSIDAGYGCVFNIEVPPSNYPIGILGSQTPSYGGGTVYHYIAGMGYDNTYPGGAVYIADPGFPPFHYWVAFDQLATMIPPKGFTVATIQPDPLEELMSDLTNQQKLDEIHDKLTAYPDVPAIAGKWPSRARYAPDPTAGIDDTVGMILWTDANVYDLFVEFAASQGFESAKQAIAARAKADPTDDRAAFFTKKYPA